MPGFTASFSEIFVAVCILESIVGLALLVGIIISEGEVIRGKFTDIIKGILVVFLNCCGIGLVMYGGIYSILTIQAFGLIYFAVVGISTLCCRGR